MSWLIFLIFLLLKKLELFVCSTFPSTCFQRWEVETGLKNVKRLTTVEQPSEGPCGFSTWLTFAPSCHVFFRLAKISHPLSSFFFYFFFFFPLPLGSLTLVKFLARNPVKRLQKSAFEHVFESSFEVDLQVVFCFGNELLIITINYWIFFDQVSWKKDNERSNCYCGLKVIVIIDSKTMIY